jgi:hypothetical protein
MSVSVQNVHRGTRTLLLFFLIIAIADFCVPERLQADPRKNFVLVGQEFLRSLYPQLNHKKNYMTVATSMLYDDPADPVNEFELSVGEGPKDLLRGYSEGCMGTPAPPPSQFLQPFPGTFTIPTSPAETSPDPQHHAENCSKGPIYPKQFLTSAFAFGEGGELLNFSATGPAVGNQNAYGEVSKLADEHPEFSSNQVAEAMKQAGAKFGPNDKKDFVNNLPIAILERFLGKIRLISVEFTGLDRPILPMWIVIAKAKTTAGNNTAYEMRFEPFKGDLISLETIPYQSRIKP